MKKCLIPVMIAVFTVFTSSAFSAVTVTYSPTAPTENILKSVPLPIPANRAGNTWKWIETAQPYNEVGQLFTSDFAFELESISLYTAGASSAGGYTRTFTLFIDEFTGATLNGGRTTVWSQTGVLPSLGLGGQYVNFDLGDSVAIETDKIYGFRLAFNEQTPNSSMAITLSNLGTQPFGEHFYYYNPSTSSNLVSISTQSAVYYMTGVAIPEPGTALLGVLGGIGLMLRHTGCDRRKKKNVI